MSNKKRLVVNVPEELLNTINSYAEKVGINRSAAVIILLTIATDISNNSGVDAETSDFRFLNK